VTSGWMCEGLENKNPDCEAVAYSIAPSQIVADAYDGIYKILLHEDKSWDKYSSLGHRE
jgi:hypothetical protein